VAIDTKDFGDFLVEEKLHVAISAKDFKAIILHADTLNATLVARYTRPCRPLQLSYEAEGMICEFTLMTRGEVGETSATSSLGNARELPARPLPAAEKATPAGSAEMAPALNPIQLPKNATAQSSFHDATNQEAATRPLQREPVSIDPDSLFLPVDDDQQWDEPNYGDEEEDTLGWDASIDHVSLCDSISAILLLIPLPRMSYAQALAGESRIRSLQ
jgi:cell cycle checkpoint control protein RAD9A